MTDQKCCDRVILDQWHPISSLHEIQPGRTHHTVLLGENISYEVTRNQPRVRSGPQAVHAMLAYGFLWACLGTPPAQIFSFDEYAESDRRNVPTGMFGVHVSAGRAIENFLDMAHFPYVHTGILGEEPHTEVQDYDVEVSETREEVLATRCRFYQPRAALSAQGGAMVDYIYRVPHVNCALLYKSSPSDPDRMDVIFLFLQPMGPELVRAHTGMCVIDADNSDESIRYFQQVIFGQDKPILENQNPKRLPLDPRDETPIRADKSAIAYRRWLGRKGLTYGVIPVAA